MKRRYGRWLEASDAAVPTWLWARRDEWRSWKRRRRLGTSCTSAINGIQVRLVRLEEGDADVQPAECEAMFNEGKRVTLDLQLCEFPPSGDVMWQPTAGMPEGSMIEITCDGWGVHLADGSFVPSEQALGNGWVLPVVRGDR